MQQKTQVRIDYMRNRSVRVNMMVDALFLMLNVSGQSQEEILDAPLSILSNMISLDN